MKRIISGVLALTLCASLLCSCEKIKSNSAQTSTSTTTSSVSDQTGIASDEPVDPTETDQSGESQPESESEPIIDDIPMDPSYLEITMKEWDQMNANEKYTKMKAILNFITDSGVTTKLDFIDLVTALDQSGNTSAKKTVYALVLKEINKSNEQ